MFSFQARAPLTPNLGLSGETKENDGEEECLRHPGLCLRREDSINFSVCFLPWFAGQLQQACVHLKKEIDKLRPVLWGLFMALVLTHRIGPRKVFKTACMIEPSGKKARSFWWGCVCFALCKNTATAGRQQGFYPCELKCAKGLKPTWDSPGVQDSPGTPVMVFKNPSWMCIQAQDILLFPHLILEFPELPYSQVCGSTFLVAIGFMLFKSIEEGGNGRRVFPFIWWCAAKDISMSLFFPTLARMLPLSATEHLAARKGGKIWSGWLKTVKLCVGNGPGAENPQSWWSQTSWTPLSMWHLHQRCPWPWLLTLAVFSLRWWVHGDCTAQNNNGASCPAEQAAKGHSSSGKPFFLASCWSWVCGRKNGLTVRTLDW